MKYMGMLDDSAVFTAVVQQELDSAPALIQFSASKPTKRTINDSPPILAEIS
jgi:hypothetical protein